MGYYRKYSDGFIEQWGIFNNLINQKPNIVEFVKSFENKDSIYISITPVGAWRNSFWLALLQVSSYTTKNFTIPYTDTTQVSTYLWKACGY